MSKAREVADSLKEEAKTRLSKIFKESNLVYSFGDVDRIVDCIVYASILEVADLQSEAIKK